MQPSRKTKSMFLVVINGFLCKLYYTLVGTRYQAKAATEKSNGTTKHENTFNKREVVGGDLIISVFRGPGEAVKVQPRHTAFVIILL